MKFLTKSFAIVLFCVISLFSFSQNASNSPNTIIKLNPDKVNVFVKYLEFRHSFDPGGYDTWKKENPDLYQKEMWYYSESFYIKRNYLSEGISLPEGSIYIPRFESSRKANEEAIVVLPGFKDVLVLLPENKLIYKAK